jgi:hypothetical protein
MRLLTLRFNALWRFFRAKASRVNRVLSVADDDNNMVFQVHSEEKKLLERKGPSASSSGNADERTN